MNPNKFHWVLTEIWNSDDQWRFELFGFSRPSNLCTLRKAGRRRFLGVLARRRPREQAPDGIEVRVDLAGFVPNWTRLNPNWIQIESKLNLKWILLKINPFLCFCTNAAISLFFNTFAPFLRRNRVIEFINISRRKANVAWCCSNLDRTLPESPKFAEMLMRMMHNSSF